MYSLGISCIAPQFQIAQFFVWHCYAHAHLKRILISNHTTFTYCIQIKRKSFKWHSSKYVIGTYIYILQNHNKEILQYSLLFKENIFEWVGWGVAYGKRISSWWNKYATVCIIPFFSWVNITINKINLLIYKKNLQKYT